MSTNLSLTSTQDQVLAMIAAGFTATAAAERAGVHRNTIAYWLRSEEFRTALEKARGEKEILYWDQAEALAAEAVNHLRSMMYDAPPAPARISTPKIGRNELCPCGSGIKFKYCCLGKAVPPNENAPAA